jgi:hypothetical protein
MRDAQWQALRDYGAAIGLAFQVVDDILDVTPTRPRWARPPARMPAGQAHLCVGAGAGALARLCQASCWPQALRRWTAAAARYPRRCGAGAHGEPSTGPIDNSCPDATTFLPCCSDTSTTRPTCAACRAPAQDAGVRAARLPARQRVQDRRAPELQPGHGRADGGAALCVQHARTTAGVGRGPPDLSAQDPDRPARPHGQPAPAGRPERAFRSAPRANTTPSARRTPAPRSRPRWAWRWRRSARAKTARRWPSSATAP